MVSVMKIRGGKVMSSCLGGKRMNEVSEFGEKFMRIRKIYKYKKLYSCIKNYMNV